MFNHKLELKEVDVIVSATCDRCGVTYPTFHNSCQGENIEFMVINAEWGYFALDGGGHSLDGKTHTALICSRCFLTAMKLAGINLITTEKY